MINLLEDRVMVSHIPDAVNNGNPIKSDSQPNTKQSDDVMKHLADKALKQSDSICLSQCSKQLEALKASLQDLPEVNAARVLYFKNEIESGNYVINSSNIANKMLNLVETV